MISDPLSHHLTEISRWWDYCREWWERGGGAGEWSDGGIIVETAGEEWGCRGVVIWWDYCRGNNRRGVGV